MLRNHRHRWLLFGAQLVLVALFIAAIGSRTSSVPGVADAAPRGVPTGVPASHLNGGFPHCSDPRDTSGGCQVITITYTLTGNCTRSGASILTPYIRGLGAAILFQISRPTGPNSIRCGDIVRITVSSTGEFLITVTHSNGQPVSYWYPPILVRTTRGRHSLIQVVKNGGRLVPGNAIYSPGLYRFN